MIGKNLFQQHEQTYYGFHEYNFFKEERIQVQSLIEIFLFVLFIFGIEDVETNFIYFFSNNMLESHQSQFIEKYTIAIG